MSARTKKQPEYRDLTPTSEVGKRFTHWFNHGWDFIEKTPNGWTTVKEYPLSPREIWDSHQDPATLIGLRFGSTTRFITLDIDRHSPYHPAHDPAKIGNLKAALEQIGLCRGVLVRSSDSDGLHLIYPLPAQVPSFKAACLVQTTLKSAGFEVKKGQLEIFPNPKRAAKKGQISLYNGIRLPLQPGSGSYLLDDDLNLVSERVEDFLDQMDWAAASQDLESFTPLLDPSYENYKARSRWQEDTLSEKAARWQRSLETTLALGWTGYGQTNYLLTKIVTHAIVFLKLQGQQLRESVFQQVINAPGYQQYCRHQHEIDRRIEEICHYTELNSYYLPYCNHPERVSTFEGTYAPQSRPAEKTTGKQEDTRNRLLQTVAYLEEKGELPDGITARKEIIQATAKERHGRAFSISTLSHRQYLPYWHPKYRHETSRATRENQESSPPPVAPLEKPEPLPEEGSYPSEAEAAPNANPTVGSTPSNSPPKTLKPSQDNRSYRSEANLPEKNESESTQTLTGQAVVSIAPLNEVCLPALTEKSQVTCSFSQGSASAVLALPEGLHLSENRLLKADSSFSRKRYRALRQLTLVQRLEKWKARRIPLVYTGNPVSGLIETKERKQLRLYLLNLEETVLISDLHHTSFLFHPEDEDNLIIYVKPIERLKEWKTGIAVLAKYLQPKSSDSPNC